MHLTNALRRSPSPRVTCVCGFSVCLRHAARCFAVSVISSASLSRSTPFSRYICLSVSLFPFLICVFRLCAFAQDIVVPNDDHIRLKYIFVYSTPPQPLGGATSTQRYAVFCILRCLPATLSADFIFSSLVFTFSPSQPRYCEVVACKHLSGQSANVRCRSPRGWTRAEQLGSIGLPAMALKLLIHDPPTFHYSNLLKEASSDRLFMCD